MNPTDFRKMPLIEKELKLVLEECVIPIRMRTKRLDCWLVKPIHVVDLI